MASVKQVLNFLPKANFWNTLTLKGMGTSGVPAPSAEEGGLYFDSSENTLMYGRLDNNNTPEWVPISDALTLMHTTAAGNYISGIDTTTQNIFTDSSIPVMKITVVPTDGMTQGTPYTLVGTDGDSTTQEASIYISSGSGTPYSDTNPLATLHDIAAAASGVNGVTMDGASIVVTNTGVAVLLSDTTSPYSSTGNFLATVGSVAIEDASIVTYIDGSFVQKTQTLYASDDAGQNKYVTGVTLGGTAENPTITVNGAALPVTDITITEGTPSAQVSILSDGVANLYTNTSYDASNNKLATMTDITNAIGGLSGAMHWYGQGDVNSGADDLTVNINSTTYYVHNACTAAHEAWESGDVIYITADNISYEYVYNGTGWQLLGDESMGVQSIGGEKGAITLSDGLIMSSKQLTLNGATDASLGGVKLGYTTTDETISSKTYRNFALDTSSNAGYTSIPYATSDSSGIITPEQANAIANASLASTVYSVTIANANMGSGHATAVITHNLGTADMNVDVYQINGSNQYTMVFVDSVVTSENVLKIGFGSHTAFTQCQDENQGYRVVFTAVSSDKNPTFTITSE